jgi:hypothetical protein
MPREMLKLRKGDTAIMIKADGNMELAGLNDKPLIDNDGKMSPVILFAAAWAKRDPNIMNNLLTNFKSAVREGYFGEDAKRDFSAMEKRAASAATTMQPASGAVTQSKSGLLFKPNMTPEERAKQIKEEENLRVLAERAQYQANDPKMVRQKEAFKKNAKIVNKGPVTEFLEPDLPIEQTFAYQDATPEEQQKMKMEESLKILNASDAKTLEEAKKVLADTAEKKEEPIVGNVTIEEEVGNENK